MGDGGYATPAMTSEEVPVTAEATATGTLQAEAVVLEVRRAGRRPRYHVGARIHSGPGAGTAVRPEQCNLDQVALEVHELAPSEFDPGLLKRPRTQLCGRCFAGHPALEG